MDYNLNQNPQNSQPQQPEPQKHISTLVGSIIIIIVAIIAFGGVFAYQYFKVKQFQSVETALQTQQILDKQFPLAGEENLSDETAGWKTYTNTEYGFSFKYPQILKVSENNDVISNRVVLSHSVAYTHNDPCDFKGDSPQLTNLTDFYVWLNIIPSNIESIISDNSMPGYNLPKQKVDIGGLSGYKYTIGVEYCGMDYYYLSIAPKKTLWIGSKIITELSPILPKDEVNKYLAILNILDTKKSETLLNQMIYTFKFTK